MLHIALVIYNAKERIIFNEVIDEVFQNYFLGDIVYNRFSTLDDLLQSNDCFDILILDVEQQDSWDNKVLKLYHHNLMKSFYLITNDFEDIQKAFHLNALQVFSKPFNSANIRTHIRDSLANNWFYTLQGKYLHIHDICYIEFRNRKSFVFTKLGEFESSSSLKVWEQRLKGKDFCRINRFVIVNVKRTQFKGNEAHIDGTIFKVSKTYL